jgi:hypothetical protein
MKPHIRDLSKSSDPQQVWRPEDVHELLLFFRDQYFPVHDFLEEQGVPRTLTHDVYEDRDRELLERVKEWGNIRYQEGTKEGTA